MRSELSLLSQATTELGGVAPYHYWDFINNRALFAGANVGSVADTPNWSFTRATAGTYVNLDGSISTFVSGQLRRGDRGVLIEGARTNLFLNSATGVTQDISVAAAAHTLSFRGTGTITLSGASTAGPLVGTGATDTVTLTFTPSAATLTLTVSGSCTNVQLEAGAFATSWIPTEGTGVTRNADVLLITSPSVDCPMTVFGEYERAIDVGAAAVETLLHVDAGSTDDRVLIRTNASDLAELSVVDGTVAQALITVAGAITAGSIVKMAGRISTNSAQIAKGGTLGTEDTGVTLPATPTHIRIGTVPAGTNQPNNYIRRIAIIDSAVNDAGLQAMTS